MIKVGEFSCGKNTFRGDKQETGEIGGSLKYLSNSSIRQQSFYDLVLDAKLFRFDYQLCGFSAVCVF